MSLFGGLAFLVFALLINLNIIRVLHVVVPMQSRFQMQQRFSKSLKYGMVIVQVHRKLTLKVASTNFLVWLLFWTESHQPYTLLPISRHLRNSTIVMYCIYTFKQRFLQCTPIRSAYSTPCAILRIAYVHELETGDCTQLFKKIGNILRQKNRIMRNKKAIKDN